MSNSKGEKQAVATSTTVPVDPTTDDHHPNLSELRRADDVLLAQLGYKAEFRREFSVSESPIE